MTSMMSLLNVRNIIFSPAPEKKTGVTSVDEIYCWWDVVDTLPELGPVHEEKETESKLMGLYYGDITKIGGSGKVAIVNAANNTLRQGGGVSGQIHRAAGPELEKACLQFKDIPEVTDCRITPGFKLPASLVIHAVTPGLNRPHELHLTYMNALKLAHDSNVNTVIFPALSTGTHNFEPNQASVIAVGSGMTFLKETGSLDMKIIYCVYEQSHIDMYKAAFTKVFATSKENDKGWEVDFK